METKTVEKYLELIDKKDPRYALEKLYLFEYGRVPQIYYIRGKESINSTITELTGNYKSPEGEQRYNIKNLFRKLMESEKYIGVLETPYCIANRADYVVLMKDAIIELDSTLFPDISDYGKDLKIYTHENPKEYTDLVEWEVYTENQKELNFSFLTQTISGGLKERKMKIIKMEIDIEKNYNSDLPLSEIKDFIESSLAGLMIFNGQPGTGKSSFLKYLISEYPNKEWVVVPSKILLNCGEGNLVDYFMKDKDRIYILEDCEKLILRREKGNNLETFLNLTDGLIGDAIHPKFICTFNTPLSNIDPALLRKGRLKIRYEFGPLSLEKTKKHIPEATSPMILADIYNQGENGGEMKRRKIGY